MTDVPMMMIMMMVSRGCFVVAAAAIITVYLSYELTYVITGQGKKSHEGGA
jgi:hypothetical protein